MSRGEFNKFGYKGYVRAIIDGRGMNFCEECTDFLRRSHGLTDAVSHFFADGLLFCHS